MLLVAFVHLSNEISATVITEDAIEGVPPSFIICGGINRGLGRREGGRERSATKGLAGLVLHKG